MPVIPEIHQNVDKKKVQDVIILTVEEVNNYKKKVK
jgi:hypothetical protein